MTKKDGPIARWKRSISAAITEVLLIWTCNAYGWMDAIIFSTCIANKEGGLPCYSHQLGLWSASNQRVIGRKEEGVGEKRWAATFILFICAWWAFSIWERVIG